MPQIWVTPEELAAYLGCDRDAAVAAIAELGLAGRDDGGYVLLPPGLAAQFAAVQPAVRHAVLADVSPLPLRDIDEAALTAAAAAGGPDYVAGEFTDLLVARLRSLGGIAAAADGRSAAS